MNWFDGMSRWISNWGQSFKQNGIHGKDRYRGRGMTNHPRNHNSNKSTKSIKKNRSGRKARQQNRRK